MTAEYVYVRTDSPRHSLQRAYTGPYQVIKRNTHTFTLKMVHGFDNIAINRLKPAAVGPSTFSSPVIPRRRGRPKTTSGGSDVVALSSMSRHIRWDPLSHSFINV